MAHVSHHRAIHRPHRARSVGATGVVLDYLRGYLRSYQAPEHLVPAGIVTMNRRGESARDNAIISRQQRKDRHGEWMARRYHNMSLCLVLLEASPRRHGPRLLEAPSPVAASLLARLRAPC